MYQGIFEIKENRKIAKDVWQMDLTSEKEIGLRPGQFVEIQLDGYYLRRPISVADATDHSLTIIYKVVGKGTEVLSRMSKGNLDLLYDLGNGYDLSLSGEKPLLIGGGVGVPPLYYLAKELRKENKEVSVILGFNTKEEVFYEEEFKALGCDVTVCTADGSYGLKGFVTEGMKEKDYSYFYTCGPLPMLKAVYNYSTTSGQFSFEERMGCGYGVCMGCTTKVKGGYKRLCKEGPVLNKEEIVWED